MEYIIKDPNINLDLELPHYLPEKQFHRGSLINTG